MKRLFIVLFACISFFVGCASQPKDISSAVVATSQTSGAKTEEYESGASSSAVSSNASFSGSAVDSLVGNWLNPSTEEDPTFRGFVFTSDHKVSFIGGVTEGGYDVFSGSYSVEESQLTMSIVHSMGEYGEDLTADFLIENDVLTLSNIQASPFSVDYLSFDGLFSNVSTFSISKAKGHVPWLQEFVVE